MARFDWTTLNLLHASLITRFKKKTHATVSVLVSKLFTSASEQESSMRTEIISSDINRHTEFVFNEYFQPLKMLVK